MPETKLLGTGYPWAVDILDNILRETKRIFVDEESGMKIKSELKDGNTRFLEIGGNMYFWSDVRKCERVAVPIWLDELLFKSGKIQKAENRKKVLVELTNRNKQGRKFRDEDDVFNFLSLNQ